MHPLDENDSLNRPLTPPAKRHQSTQPPLTPGSYRRPPPLTFASNIVDTLATGTSAPRKSPSTALSHPSAEKAVKWINGADEAALIEVLGYNRYQLNQIQAVRPFASVEALKKAFQSVKHLVFKTFTSHMDELAALETIDSILLQCNEIASRLASASSASGKLQITRQPKSMAKEVKLKVYQLEGVNWLLRMYQHRFSCILADDMDLGKTCQVVAFLCSLRERGYRGVNLIIAHASAVGNWLQSIKQFGPSLEVRTYAGSQGGRLALPSELVDDPSKYDVALTTHAQVAEDLEFFKRFQLNACIFDLRKEQSLHQPLELRPKWTLLLTDTPIQNNLLDSMDLLRFISPQVFKDAKAAFATLIDCKKGLTPSLIGQAKQMLSPYALRRVKEDFLPFPSSLGGMGSRDMDVGTSEE